MKYCLTLFLLILFLSLLFLSSSAALWYEPLNLSESVYNDSNPMIFAESVNNLHIVSEKHDGSYCYNVIYMKSVDGGLSWSVPVNVTNGPNSSYWSDVAVSGGVVHVVYCQQDSENNSILYTYYTNSSDGVNFNPPINMSEPVGYGCFEPKVEVDGSSVYVLSIKNNITSGLGNTHFSYSNDLGATWNRSIEIFTGNYTAYIDLLVGSGGELHAVWAIQNVSTYVLAYSSSNNGSVWSDYVNLTNTSFSAYYARIIQYDDGSLFVFFKNYTSKIFFVNSSDGITWSEPYEVTADFNAFPAGISVSSTPGLINLFYSSNFFPPDILYAYSSDRGYSWSAAENISNSSVFSNNVWSASLSGKLFVVWTEFVNGSTYMFFSSNYANATGYSGDMYVSAPVDYSFFVLLAVISLVFYILISFRKA